MLVYSVIGSRDKRDLQKDPVIYFHFASEEESSHSQEAASSTCVGLHMLSDSAVSYSLSPYGL